jgi:hypothetical protein
MRSSIIPPDSLRRTERPEENWLFEYDREDREAGQRLERKSVADFPFSLTSEIRYIYETQSW